MASRRIERVDTHPWVRALRIATTAGAAPRFAAVCVLGGGVVWAKYRGVHTQLLVVAGLVLSAGAGWLARGNDLRTLGPLRR
jgi:hypothetical protein